MRSAVRQRRHANCLDDDHSLPISRSAGLCGLLRSGGGHRLCLLPPPPFLGEWLFQADNQLPWYAIGFSIVAAGISSEQFVGEMGYAYKLGLPVANWEWLVLPALSVLLWVFVPLYVRHRIATMPEYLERRFGRRLGRCTRA